MEVFTMDGKTWDIKVEEIKQRGEVTDTDKSGRTISGKMIRDIIGTYYNYTLTVSVNQNNYAAFDAFFNAITAPVEYHTVSFPHNQAYLSFNAYITSAERSLMRMKESFNRWGKMTINFIAMEPQRPYGG